MSKRFFDDFYFKFAGYLYILLGLSFSFVSAKQDDAIGFLFGMVVIMIGTWLKGRQNEEFL